MMYGEIFNHKIKEYLIQFGSAEPINYRFVEEFDNGTHSGGSMKGMSQHKINDHFIKSKGYSHYFLRGRYNTFFSAVDVDYGYKFFSKAGDKPFHYIPLSKDGVQRMFDIHQILYEGGFGPKPIAVLPKDKNFGKFLQIEKPKGVFSQPPKEWTNSLVEFCKSKGIYRNCKDAPMEWEATKPTNCIKTTDGIKFIDIDYKWEYR